MQTGIVRPEYQSKKVIEYYLIVTEFPGQQDSTNDRKLLPRRLGPFNVTAVDEQLSNYTLVEPHTLRIHKVFARDCITKYKEPTTNFPSRKVSPPINEPIDPKFDYEVENILDHKTINHKLHYLIKWVGYGDEHNSWGPATNINAPSLLKAYRQSWGV
jgi:hypothetical protein